MSDKLYLEYEIFFENNINVFIVKAINSKVKLTFLRKKVIEI